MDIEKVNEICLWSKQIEKDLLELAIIQTLGASISMHKRNLMDFLKFLGSIRT